MSERPDPGRAGPGSGTDRKDPASTRRGGHRRAESRNRLIEAARDVFADRGIRDTPVELICETAGFTRGAFYSNFPSKEELFLAVWETETTKRQQRIAEAIAATVDLPLPDDVAGLRAVVSDMARRYVTVSTGDETWFKLLLEFRLLGLRQESLRPRAEAVFDQEIEEFAGVIDGFVTRAGIRLTVSPEYVARAVLALYNEALGSNLLHGLPLTEDNEFLVEVIPCLLSGLLAESDDVPPEERDLHSSP